MRHTAKIHGRKLISSNPEIFDVWMVDNIEHSQVISIKDQSAESWCRDVESNQFVIGDCQSVEICKVEFWQQLQFILVKMQSPQSVRVVDVGCQIN